MTDRPDIVLIMTDQQRYDTIRSLGCTHIDTPNLDRLVEEGKHFTECHVTAPSCVPCRASFFTGYYPHTTGILANGQAWSKTGVSDVRAAGYRTVNIGKMHTIPYDAEAGFDERFVVENKDRFMEGRWYFDEWDKALAAHGLKKQQRVEYRKTEDYCDRLGAFTWDLPKELHSDVFVGKTAEWWLDTKPVDKPLFLTVGFPGPHPPYDPTPDFAEKYMAREIPLPCPTQEELDTLPPPFHEKRVHDVKVDDDSVSWKMNPTRDELHRMRAYYAANVEMIDTEVGRLIDALERRGNLDNTIIVFTSDHGDNLGDHGLSQKWAPYDQVTRVPMIVWSPGRFAPGRVDQMIQLFDIAPTILEWAGVTPCDSFEAETLTDALTNQPFEGRKYVFCEQGGDVNLTGANLITMVRSETHKLVHFQGQTYGQLFDLVKDPSETQNCWDDGDYTEVRNHLLSVLLNWHVDSALRTKSVRSHAVNPFVGVPAHG